MFNFTGWNMIDVPDMATLPRPIFLRAQQLPPKTAFPLHTHHWHQFVYATSGSLVVAVEEALYVITPEQAIWIPIGIEHTTGALNGAEFRNLYVADVPHLQMPNTCTVYTASLLLKALVVELEPLANAATSDPYWDKVEALLFAHLSRLVKQDFHLPWASSPKLQLLCETIYNTPSDPRSIADWGQQLGASPRTLERHFEKEVGIPLREWRYRLRLYLALEWLCTDQPITDIAFALGYASTSAFTYMFSAAMGCTPSKWKNRQRHPVH